HFGQTVFALCNYPSLLTNGILRLEQMEDTPLEDFSAEYYNMYVFILSPIDVFCREQREHHIGKGAAGVRGDDMKMLKSAVLDWIVPQEGAIQPPLHRNLKIDCGFNHDLTGFLLCPVGLDWNDSHPDSSFCPSLSIGLKKIYEVTYDSEDPWNGLLRSRLLVCAYKLIFTSPSSVEKEPKATQSSNARLHGMNSVTATSIAYIATQVRFALSSSSVFLRTNTTTDSETFYHSLLDLLEDPDESKEVDKLLMWWNCQVFPTSSAAKKCISANSALSKIHQKHLALKQLSGLNIESL
ncbi:uncharacterized protein EDB93DRAFT_1095331, partial [Suillus bovinus]|uniref:uncharacterized protein n=1 Tax=Suillus bovinus TaxID=48563 RepID=UPI001B86520D